MTNKIVENALNELTEISQKILGLYQILIEIELNYKKANHNNDYLKDAKYNKTLLDLRTLIQEERFIYLTLTNDLGLAEIILDTLSSDISDNNNIVFDLTSAYSKDRIKKRIIRQLQDLITSNKKSATITSQFQYGKKTTIDNIHARSFEQKLINDSQELSSGSNQSALYYKYYFAYLSPQIEKLIIENKFNGSITNVDEKVANEHQNEYVLIAYSQAIYYARLFNANQNSCSEETLLMMIYSLQAAIKYLPPEKKEAIHSVILSDLFGNENDAVYKKISDAFTDETVSLIGSVGSRGL